MSQFLEDALTYLDLGWCVYPAHWVDLDQMLCTCGKLDCPCPGKHPIGGWAEFRNRLPTKYEVQSWFTAMQCNIGMVTGRISDVVVVDVDGAEGRETLATLNLEPTLTARTGGGGSHHFYSIANRASFCSAVRILPGIDIRGDGGYVVLPPSLHKSGKRYKWEDIRPMAPFDPTQFVREGSSRPGYTENTAMWFDELLDGVSEGSRNISAAKLAGRYFNLGLTHKEVTLMLSAWNTRNYPPLDTSELRITIAYIGAKHRDQAIPLQVNTLNEVWKLLKGANK